MATDVPADLVLSPIGREPRTIAEWTTMFHLAVVVLDPYTYESSWILDTATRVLRTYAGADCRVAFLVTADEADTRTFLGPLVDEFLAFFDPERLAVKSFGLEQLPAFVHINQSHAIEAKAEGWQPRRVARGGREPGRHHELGPPEHPRRRRPHPLRGHPAL